MQPSWTCNSSGRRCWDYDEYGINGEEPWEQDPMYLVALFVPSGCDYNLGQRLLAHVFGSTSVASVETEPSVDVINGSLFFPGGFGDAVLTDAPLRHFAGLSNLRRPS